MNSKSIIMWGTSEMLLVLLITVFCHHQSPAHTSIVRPTKFDTSNEWRTIELTNLNDDEQFYQPMSIRNESHSPASSNNKNNSKKLVEWDDDDNFVGASLVVQEPKLTTKVEQTSGHQKSRYGKTGKLVYHGQLKRNNSRVIIDGLSLKVNTYLPHSINRNQQQTIGRHNSAHHEHNQHHHEHQHQPSSSSQPNIEILTYEKPGNMEMNINQNSLSEDTEAYPKSENEWHPITVTSSKYRQSYPSYIQRNSKTRLAGDEGNSNKIFLYHASKPTVEISEEATVSKSRWRPITSYEVNKRLLSRKMRESITYGRKRSTDSAYQPVAPSYIEEPFEDDRIVVSGGESRREQRILEQQQQRKQQNKSNSNASSRIGLARKLEDSQWTPLEVNPRKVQATTKQPTVTSSSTVEPQTTKSPPQNQSESVVQRSASDVNYIYSSQPNSQYYDYGPSSTGAADYRQQANSYSGYGYSNYYNGGQQQDSSGGAIVDTVSGQTPEMIDRTQEPGAGYQADYGSAYTSASYQPSARPYGHYDTSAGYYTGLSRTPIPLRQASPPVQQSQAPVVRQEHHYHYYNPQQQQQQPERQQVIQQQQQQPQVVREIQPLLISQPQVIQALVSTSSTPAPQIIREIIKEVPQQVPVHYQLPPRILLNPLPAPPPPPPIALPVARASRAELEPSYGYGYGTGSSYGGDSRSLIRHFSSAMPTIGVRQIRVPVPTIQIPLRVAVAAAPLPPPTPSVTRQTGSFLVPPQPQKTTTYLTETQAMPTHTTIMQTTQFTPATRTTVYTTDHQLGQPAPLVGSSGYKKKKKKKK